MLSRRYTTNTTINPFDRYYVAVFAKTLGVPIVSACPPALLPTGWAMLSNCIWSLVDTDNLGSPPCTPSGTCVSSQATACCTPDDDYVADTDCLSGCVTRRHTPAGRRIGCVFIRRLW